MNAAVGTVGGIGSPHWQASRWGAGRFKVASSLENRLWDREETGETGSPLLVIIEQAESFPGKRAPSWRTRIAALWLPKFWLAERRRHELLNILAARLRAMGPIEV